METTPLASVRIAIPRNRVVRWVAAFGVAAGFLLAWAGCTIGPTGGESGADGGDAGDSGSEDEAGSCDTIIEWGHNGEFNCTECTRMYCASEQVLLDQAQTACAEDMQAALACNTCACGRNALANQPDCANALETYLACKVAKCEAYCK